MSLESIFAEFETSVLSFTKTQLRSPFNCPACYFRKKKPHTTTVSHRSTPILYYSLQFSCRWLRKCSERLQALNVMIVTRIVRNPWSRRRPWRCAIPHIANARAHPEFIFLSLHSAGHLFSDRELAGNDMEVVQQHTCLTLYRMDRFCLIRTTW